MSATLRIQVSSGHKECTFQPKVPCYRDRECGKKLLNLVFWSAEFKFFRVSNNSASTCIFLTQMAQPFPNYEGHLKTIEVEIMFFREIRKNSLIFLTIQVF